jgi:hypothetical protein
MPMSNFEPQPWSCDRCGLRGEVQVPAGSGPNLALKVAAEVHRALSEVCWDEWGSVYVRLAQTAPLPD